MALLQDLIQQIDDPVLRERIMQETDKLVKQKKFGLLFEDGMHTSLRCAYPCWVQGCIKNGLCQ